MNTSMSKQCPHCGGIHSAKCPLIKAIEYHQDGTVKRVEFYSQNDYRELQIKPDLKIQQGHYDSEGYCDNPARGY